ncbi:MAG: PD40 domain-containing protein [Bacteroidales bacterium]|nr:PD40 domain-containing protein [Bacteroidales bacterium]
MKRTLVAAAFLLAAMTSANAQFGVWQASETTKVKDPGTGIELNVLTRTDLNDRYLYQTDPMWTPDCKYLLFRSSSRGEAEERTMPDGTTRRVSPSGFYMIEVATGKIIQVTEGNVGSAFLGNTANTLYINTREGNGPDAEWVMNVMDLDKLFSDAKKQPNKARKMSDYIKRIGTFPNSEEMGRPGGWCINSDDTFAYITVSRNVMPTDEELAIQEKVAQKPREDQPVKVGQGMSGLRKMNLKTGEVSFIRNVPFRVGHIQASRFRPNEILFCCETGGDAGQRMWYCDANTNEYKPLYKETPLDWVTHETFGTEDYVYFNVLGWQDRLRKQASGIFRINLRTDDVEVIGQVEMDQDRTTQLTGRGFWHCNSTRDNKWACGDTFGGSVWIVNVANGLRIQIASDLKMQPDHAQPFFSPDGTKICFQSGHYSDAKRLNLIMVDLTKIPLFVQNNK